MNIDQPRSTTPEPVEMPEPLTSNGMVVLQCHQFHNYRTIQAFSYVFAHYASDRDWLRRALAWCEQGEANKEAKP